MDRRRRFPAAFDDEAIAAQLRAYGDALATRPRRPADVGKVEVGRPARPRSRRLAVALVAAAVVAAAIVGFALRGVRDPVRTDTVDRTENTPEPDAPAPGESDDATSDDGENGSGPIVDEELSRRGARLLPDSSGWVVVEYHSSGPTEATTEPPGDDGIWVWRQDDALHILRDGFADDGLGALDNAEVHAESDTTNRASIGWVDDAGRSMSLQTIVDRPPAQRAELVKITARSLEPLADGGWALPGADPVVAEPVTRQSGPAEQIGLAPVEDGVTAPVGRVISIVSQRSLGSLYGELGEASSLGVVAEVSIADGVGYLIEGDDVAYALAFHDGMVTSWQTAAVGDDVDLAGLLASVRPVEADRWRTVVDGVDETVEEAIDAAVDAAAADRSLSGRPDGPPPERIPRYRLPASWQLNWVTDMGLWTDDQWSQRGVLEAANDLGGGVWELLVTQAFRRTGASGDLPVDLPEYVVQIRRAEDVTLDRLLDAPVDAESISIAGWDGWIETVEYGSGAIEVSVSAADAGHVLRVHAPGRSRAEVEAFVAELEPRGAMMAAGVRLTGTEHEQLFSLASRAGDGSTATTRWHAAYADPLGRAPSTVKTVEGDTTFETWFDHGPVVSVELLDEDQLALFLSAFPGEADPRHRPVEGGRYILSGPAGNLRLHHYDAGRGVLTTVHRYGATVQELIALHQSLEEVSLDDWREYVDGFNADPVRPR